MTDAIVTKFCARCSQELPLSEFYRRGDKPNLFRSHCKACMAEYGQVYRRRPEAQARDRKRQRERYLHPDVRERRLAYMRTYMRERRRKYGRLERREHKQAWAAVERAVLRGDLPRITTLYCAGCGAPAQEYHHESYTQEKWLNVTPFCRFCHQTRHIAANGGMRR